MDGGAGAGAGTGAGPDSRKDFKISAIPLPEGPFISRRGAEGADGGAAAFFTT